MADAKHTPEELRKKLVDHGGRATHKANVREGGHLVYRPCLCRWCKAWRAELLAAIAKATGSAS